MRSRAFYFSTPQATITSEILKEGLEKFGTGHSTTCYLGGVELKMRNILGLNKRVSKLIWEFAEHDILCRFKRGATMRKIIGKE